MPKGPHPGERPELSGGLRVSPDHENALTAAKSRLGERETKGHACPDLLVSDSEQCHFGTVR